MKAAPSALTPAEESPRRVRGVAKNPVEARRKLIESAIRLFGRKGFTATSTEEIAERAGYGQATIFFHFKTKAGLLEACFDYTLERAQTSLAAADHSGTIDLMRRLDRAFDDGPQAEFFARMMAELSGNARFGPVYAAFHTQLRQLIEAELVRETGAAADRCHEAAAILMSMMVGIHAEHRIAPAGFERGHYSAMLLKIVTLVMDDLAAAGRTAKKD